jgi:hypothetical protein
VQWDTMREQRALLLALRVQQGVLRRKVAVLALRVEEERIQRHLQVAAVAVLRELIPVVGPPVV